VKPPDESPFARFQRALKVPAGLAQLLVDGRLTSLEDLAYVPFAEPSAITRLGDDEISSLRRVAELYLQNDMLDDAFGD
jgi:hypothetical protein